MEEKLFYNYAMEEMRASEFPALKDVTYLDHAGATLYSRSHMEAFQRDVITNLYGNPHSACASSKLSSDCIDNVRFRVLKLFNTTPEEYSVIFTSGATAALKLLSESFSFCKCPPQEKSAWKGRVSSNGSRLSTGKDERLEAKKEIQPQEARVASFVPLETRPRDEMPRVGYFVYLQDNHTSVQGMREVVAEGCRAVLCVSEEEVGGGLTEHSLVCGQLPGVGDGPGQQEVDLMHNSLFAFPAQSNFSGRKYPLQWVSEAQLGVLGFQRRLASRWHVVLDAACMVSTSPLDLRQFCRPDFVALSFYKIFGFPTGLGALLVRRGAERVLERRYYGGGTVAASTARQRFCVLKPALADRFEDGTLPYLDIIALRHGLDTLEKLTGGMERVSQHTFLIAQHFAGSLCRLRHANGSPLAEVFCHDSFLHRDTQGAIVNFLLKRSTGQYIGFAEVDKLAQVYDIHLRTGCFCNIGACQTFLGLESSTIRDNLDAGHVCGDDKDLINGRPTGSVRVSFGYMSTLADADRCLRFIVQCFLDVPDRASVLHLLHPPPWLASPSPQQSPSPQTVQQETVPLQHAPRATHPHWLGTDSQVRATTQCDAKTLQPQEMMCDERNTQPQEVTYDEINDVEEKQQREARCTEKGRWLTDIYLFPIKSAGAFKVSEWELCERGLRYDRTWVVVGESGVAISQKREPRLCLLRPAVHLRSRTLQLSFPGMAAFSLPLDVSVEEAERAELDVCRSKVCNDRVTTVDCGDAVAQWISQALQRPGLRLLRQLEEDARTCKRRDLAYGGDDGGQNVLSLANESQLLVLSRPSVRALQQRLAGNYDVTDAKDDVITLSPQLLDEDSLVERFRANLVLEGVEAWEEESWLTLRCGAVLLTGQGKCGRCGMICLDQTTGERTREPLQTLASWRGGKVNFGVYMRPTVTPCQQILRVGSEVTVT